jgi:hypothetical protein
MALELAFAGEGSNRQARLAGRQYTVGMSDDEPTSAPPSESERPAEVFKKGLGLLWKAARSAADEIKREVEKGGVAETLQQAGRDLEDAANQAAKALEGFIERAGSHKPRYSDRWPPAENETVSRDATTDPVGPDGRSSTGQPPQPQGAAPASPDGGLDEQGEPRDIRIQIDENG